MNKTYVNSIDFCIKNINKEEIKGKDILDVGSLYHGTSIRPYIIKNECNKYMGIDIYKGREVDLVCDAGDIFDIFGENSFDIIISTQMMEHVKYWKKVIHNFKMVVKPSGFILITTVMPSFGCHLRPDDFWRYKAEDMKYIFSDFEKILIGEDSKTGLYIFVKAYKPEFFIENDLSKYDLYSISEEDKMIRRKRENKKRKRRKRNKIAAIRKGEMKKRRREIKKYGEWNFKN